MRADVEKVLEAAHLVDLDLEAGLAALRGTFDRFLARRRLFLQRLGLEAAKVEMVAGEKQAATGAGAAGPFRHGFGLAKQELGDPFGERELADAARTVDQQGVRQSRQPLADGFEDRLVPGVHQSPASSRVIALRIEP